MSEEHIKFYSVPHHHCSCTDEHGNLKNIGKYYKEFFDRINEGGEEISYILDSLEFTKMCCRTKFLSLSYMPMINRSYDRYYDDRQELITKDTRTLVFRGKVPEFPLLGK